MFKIFTISILLTIATLADSLIHKTGQTQSYDENGSIVTDGSIRDDGYYQIGLTRNYIRAAGIVTNKTTGLEWQDEYEDYNIYDPYVTTASWQGAKDYCSVLELAGGDWRLPTKSELASLGDYSRYYPAIDPVFTIVRTGDYYWSDTNRSNDDGSAWLIHSGLSLHITGGKSGDYYVRCVRKGEVAKPSNFSRSGDIVTDGVTGLQWQDDSVGSTMTWIDAIDHCEELTLGGDEDWRLPNVNELSSIVDYTSYRPSIDTSVFEHTAVTPKYFTSTQFQNGSNVFSISFDDGRHYNNGRTQSLFVRCVRNIPYGAAPAINPSLIMYLLN